MAKGISTQRTLMFLFGVIFFGLLTIRIIWSLQDGRIPDFGDFLGRNPSIHDTNSSSPSNSIFGNIILPFSTNNQTSIEMKSLGSIRLKSNSLLSMESTGLFKMEAIGKMKIDSTGSLLLEPMGTIYITPISSKIFNTLDSSIMTTKSTTVQQSVSHVSSNDQTGSNSIRMTNPVNLIYSSNMNSQPIKRIESQSSQSSSSSSLLLKSQPTSLLMSPSEGTDILLHPRKLIEIYNQSRAILPKLDLTKDFIVYFCRHLGHGVRFYYLAREGLLLHPRIHLVNNPNTADYIIYLPVSSPWAKTECNHSSYRNKTIVLDEGDGPGLFEVHDNNPEKWFLYFKRSFVSRHRGIFQGYMSYVNRGDIFPMTYTTAEAYIKLQYNQFFNRDIDILCTLRGSNHDPVRLRVREWVEEYIKARGIKNAIAGQVNSASRTVISKAYFENMYKSRIIVTSNPSGWEGDFRFCEALSSGALIFIDHMYVPRPHPFEDHKHIVYYDNNNKTDLFLKLDYYRQQQTLIEDIAIKGYLHAMKYHRAVNLADYIFKTAHVKLQNKGMIISNLRVNQQIRSSYTQTGFDMLRIAQMNAAKKKTFG